MVYLKQPEINLERRLSKEELEEIAKRVADETIEFLKKLDISGALSRKSKIVIGDYSPSGLYG